jgi:hypothetical protein
MLVYADICRIAGARSSLVRQPAKRPGLPMFLGEVP